MLGNMELLLMGLRRPHSVLHSAPGHPSLPTRWDLQLAAVFSLSLNIMALTLEAVYPMSYRADGHSSSPLGTARTCPTQEALPEPANAGASAVEARSLRPTMD